ncbi:MAG: hypothetical protein HC817_16465 [Saprospiraceae bacterium]|nr:hypothetical protein [Saprospiraceae bacterium]
MADRVGVGEANNRAGFLVKALQEDWQSPKAVHEQQEKDIKRKRQNVQKRLKELESTREVLKNNWKRINRLCMNLSHKMKLFFYLFLTQQKRV